MIVPDGWKTYKLSEFININPKVILTKDEKYSFIEMKDLDSNQKYVTPSCKRNFTGGTKFCNGDTLFARITPCLENGKICQAKGLDNNLGFGSTEFIVLRGKEKISDNEFVYYLSRTENLRNAAIKNMTGTSGRQRVEKEGFENIEFLAPFNLTEQSQIASILSSLDDKIELNLQMNKTLESIAQAIYKEWFVDFRFPGFDGELVDGLPKGWRNGTLGDIISFKNGKTSPERVDNGGYPVYGANGIIGFSNYFNADNYVTVVGRVGSFCGSTYFSQTKSWITDNAIIASPKISSGIFTFIRLRNLNLNSYRGGSGQPLINQSILSGIKTIVPNELLLNLFEETLLPIYKKIELNEKQISILIQLRDTILPKLMSGKIRVV